MKRNKKDKDGGTAFKVNTNSIEGFWSIVKRTTIDTHHWISKKHLQRYLSDIQFRYNTKAFKDTDRFDYFLGNTQGMLKYNCFIDAIISLPLKTFFTTQKKTYILVLTKKNDISQIQTDPVFNYLCSAIGESRDVNRFDIEQDDLPEAVNLFNFFKGNKTGSASINNDKRCKIQPISRFINNIEKQWIIDKDWTDKEKV